MYNSTPTANKFARYPLLSILVPTFQFTEGFLRIIGNLNALDGEDCEVIVFDDSPDDSIRNTITNLPKSYSAQLTYIHNKPALGAVSNWNALLDSAHGKYCLLMHHDEFPIGDNFLGNLLKSLQENPDVDVLILDCILIDFKNGYNRRHLPMWLRKLVINRFPQYLFRRNVIGPTAALVIRRSIYPRFDVQLRWLVDVDLYARLIKAAKLICMCPDIKIGSMLNRSDSITKRLGSSIQRISEGERAYLRNTRGTNSFWLGPYPEEPLIYRLLRAVETVCWRGLLSLTRMSALFHSFTGSRSEAMPALDRRHEP
jgi:glycosyltransferase involved in cell wall biosynthesis